MNITYFQSATDTKPTVAEMPWSDIVSFMHDTFAVERHRSDKLDAPAMIAGLCTGKRANANVRCLSFLAADFDTEPTDPRYMTFAARCDWLDQQGYAYVAYTTTKNEAPHNHYRLVMPLAVDVSPFDWLAVWHACNAKFDGAIDKATKDPARLSFLPQRWVGNPFQQSVRRKNRFEIETITLVDPFNAMRSGEGKPILSEAEIGAVSLCSLGGEEFVTGDRFLTGNRTAAGPAAKQSSYIASRLTVAETEVLARGASATAVCWTFICDAATSPLVTRWMRETLPTDQGSRDHRFCLYAARNAVQHNIPITVDALARLASDWSENHLSRSAPADIERQAENALAWAIRAPLEQPPEMAPQPSKEPK